MPAAADIPVLTTPRLTLRGHRVDDFAECAAMWADPAVVRFIGGKSFTEQEVWTRVLRYVGHWALMGYGYWAIVERQSGRFVGEVGFADFKRGLPAFGDAPEAGWALASWAHRQGFATEALQAALAWWATRPLPRRTVCMITPMNEASLRVAEKCGYREYQRTAYHDDVVVLLER